MLVLVLVMALVLVLVLVQKGTGQRPRGRRRRRRLRGGTGWVGAGVLGGAAWGAEMERLKGRGRMTGGVCSCGGLLGGWVDQGMEGLKLYSFVEAMTMLSFSVRGIPDWSDDTVGKAVSPSSRYIFVHNTATFLILCPKHLAHCTSSRHRAPAPRPPPQTQTISHLTHPVATQLAPPPPTPDPPFLGPVASPPSTPPLATASSSSSPVPIPSP